MKQSITNLIQKFETNNVKFNFKRYIKNFNLNK